MKAFFVACSLILHSGSVLTHAEIKGTVCVEKGAHNVMITDNVIRGGR